MHIQNQGIFLSDPKRARRCTWTTTMCHSHIARAGTHPTSPFTPVAPAAPCQCRKILVTLLPLPTKLRQLPSDEESIFCPFVSMKVLHIRARTDQICASYPRIHRPYRLTATFQTPPTSRALCILFYSPPAEAVVSPAP